MLRHRVESSTLVAERSAQLQACFTAAHGMFGVVAQHWGRSSDTTPPRVLPSQGRGKRRGHPAVGIPRLHEVCAHVHFENPSSSALKFHGEENGPTLMSKKAVPIASVSRQYYKVCELEWGKCASV